MVATLVRLRLLVLRNTFRRSTGQLVAVIIGGLYGALMLFGAIVALFVLNVVPVADVRTVVVLAGSVLVLGWAIIPVLVSGVEQTLDPSHLAVYPIPLNQMLLGMLLSGIVGIPGAATTLAALATFGSWLRMPGVALIALVTGALGAVTCVVISRAVTSVSSGLASGRRFREASGLLIMIPLILAGPIIIGVTRGISNASEGLPGVAEALSWTPLGAVWAVPSSVALGDPLGAVLRLLIALATLAVLLGVWRWGLARSLVTPAHAASRVRARGKVGLFAFFPGTQAGAIAARCLTYWFRDPRYLRQLIIIPILPLLFWFYATLNHSTGYLLATGPLIGFLLGISMIADVSLDSTAFALHMSKAVPGRADRLGRAWAVLTFAVPVVLVLTFGAAAVQDSWFPVPGLLGLGFGLLLTGLGVSSVTSALFVFPVPAPGDNPFRSRPGSNMANVGSTFVSWGVLAVLCLPEIALLVVSLLTGQALWGWGGLLVGVALGSVLLAVGVRQGGRLLDARAPELLIRLGKDA
ncbi:transporter [Leifsonia poae]|uniref:transporter n=1 Tax=Leifsonia poae TaxID=110933 RepID=UPI001CBFD4A0|nr:transporter [Leifsonia poae]